MHKKINVIYCSKNGHNLIMQCKIVFKIALLLEQYFNSLPLCLALPGLSTHPTCVWTLFINKSDKTSVCYEQPIAVTPTFSQLA